MARFRDWLASEIAAFAYNHIATPGARERIINVLRTGDPELRVPAPEVVIRPHPDQPL